MAGLSMLIRKDLQFGTLKSTVNRNVILDYGCDGQFSEAKKIRGLSNNYMYPNTWKDESLCKDIEHMRTSISLTDSNCRDANCSPLFNTLCKNDTKPIFILLSQGLHYCVNASAVIHTFITPVLAQLTAVVTNCPYDLSTRIRILFVGLTPTDRIAEVKYPLQRRDLIKQFNKHIQTYLRKNHKFNILYWDVYNAGLDAVDNKRTSDGVHLLSDINVLRAIIMLHTMKLVLNPVHAYNITT